MSTKVAELVVDVNVETEKAQSNLRSFNDKVKASSDNADSHTSKIGGVFSKLTSPISGATSAVGGFVTGLGKIGFAAAGLGILATGAAAASGALYKGNAQFEDYNVQFATLLRNAPDFKTAMANNTAGLTEQELATKLAGDRMKELATFGATTPFELPGVVEANKVLQGFGLQSSDTAKRFGFSKDEIMTITGDLASGTGTDFAEMATNLGKFSAGATGEAISRFQELGVVNRNELTQMGLNFDKGGALIIKSQEDMDKATGVLLTAIKGKYGGLMTAQSATFNGMASNLQDWISGTIREATKPLFEPLKNSLKGLLDFLGKNNDAIVKGLQTVVGGIATGLGAGLTFIISNMQKTFDLARDSVLTFISAFKGDWTDSSNIEPLHRVVGNLATALGDVWNFVQPLIPTFIALYEAFSPLSVMIGFVTDLLTGDLGAAFDGLGDRVIAVGDVFGVNLREPVNAVIDFIMGTAIPAIQSFAAVFMNDILPTITIVGGEILATLIPAFQSVGEFITGTLLPILGTIGEWIIANVLPALGQLGEFVTSVVIPALASFGEWLGTNLAPVFDTLVSVIVGTVLPAFGQFGDFISSVVIPKLQQIGEFIATNVMPFLQQLAEAFLNAVNMILPVLGNLVDFILNVIVPALVSWWSIIATVLKPVFDALVAVIVNVVLPAFNGIVSFVTGTLVPAFISIGTFINNNVMPILSSLASFLGGALSTAFNAISTVVSTVWKAITGFITDNWTTIKGIFDTIVSFIGGALTTTWNTLSTTVSTVWTAISGFVTSAWTTISGTFDTIVSFIGGALSTAWNSISTTVKDVWNKVSTAVSDGVESVKNALNQVIDFLASLPGKALAEAGKIGQAIVDGIVNAVKAGVETVKNAALSIVSGPLDAVKGFLGIKSPSKVFFDIGANIVKGLVNGLGANAGEVFNTLGTILQGIKLDALKEAAEAAELLAKVSGVVGSIQDNLKKLVGYISIGTDYIDAFKKDTINLINMFVSLTANFKLKMLQGVAEFADSINKIVSVLGAIENLKKLNEYGAIGKDIIYAFGQDILSLVAEVYNISKIFTPAMQALAVSFGDTIGKALSGLGTAIDVLKGLTEYSHIGIDVIYAFGQDVIDLVARVYNISKTFSEKMQENVSDFGATIGKAVGGLAAALGVLKGLSEYTVAGIDRIYAFGQDILDLVARLYNISKFFNTDMLEAVEAFGETISKALGGLDTAFNLLQSLKEYVATGYDAITAFGLDLSKLMSMMITLSSTFNVDGVKAAAVFGEAVGKILGGLSNALSLFKSLSSDKYVGIALDAVKGFGTDLDRVINMMITLAGQFDKDLVTAAAAFGEAIGKLFSGLKPAFELFEGLEKFTGIPDKVMNAFLANVKTAVEKAAAMASTMSEEMLEKVRLFGDAVQSIFDGFKSAMEVFEGLMEFVGVPSKVIGYFIDNIVYTVQLAADMATKVDVDLLEKAEKFATAIDKIFTKFKNAIDVFKSLLDFKDDPQNTIDTLLGSMMLAIKSMAEMVVKASELLVKATDFADIMDKAWKKVQEGLASQANINGSGAGVGGTGAAGGGNSTTPATPPSGDMPGGIRSFGGWYASGGIFNTKAIIGVGDSSSPEAVVPIDMLQGYIRDAVQPNTNNVQRMELALSIDSNNTGISDDRMLELLEIAVENVTDDKGQLINSKRSIYRK